MTEAFITSPLPALGNTSTRGRSYRACHEVFLRYAPETNEIEVGGNYIVFNGLVPPEQLDQMAGELHQALHGLKAEPVLLVCGGQDIVCGIGETVANLCESYLQQEPEPAPAQQPQIYRDGKPSNSQQLPIE